MPQTTINLLKTGAEANSTDTFRRGNVIELPSEGSLIATGDIHGHRRNFERIAAYADLANHSDRHVVLHEIIHGGPEDPQGGCLSYKLLFDVIRYKLEYPDQVHMILGNHDTAVINNTEVMKNGKEMNRSMQLAMEAEFDGANRQVMLALQQFLFSQPLAIRCANRIWVSHSLPADRNVEKFDPGIMSRPLKINDLVRPGSAYLLTWGRRHSQELLDKMGEAFDVDVFVLGHQPQEQGWCKSGRNCIILACEHNHGTLLPIDLGRSYTADELVESIVPLTSIS